MYPRSNSSVTMHGGVGGGTEVISAPRATLPLAPAFPHHRPFPQQHRRSPPPPPHYYNDRQPSNYGGGPIYHPDRQQHYHPPGPPQPYNGHHFGEYQEAHYPAPPHYYHHHAGEQFGNRDHYSGGEAAYGSSFTHAQNFDHRNVSGYRPMIRPMTRPADPLVGDGMLRGPQAFYERSSDQSPTYVGSIKSSQDAILLLSACDLAAKKASPSSTPSSSTSTVPPPRRVTRRLLDAERSDMVASGCVFAWDEKEAGMKRWTDGRVWSASRVSDCFLTYRELEARKKSNGSAMDGPTSNQYKPEGLIKQSFSVTTASGRKLHVISYFTKRDVREGRLRRVSEDPRFVGEGGGEWGLKVDEEEYSFPDGQNRAPGQDGQDAGQDGDGDEEDSDGLNTPSPEATADVHVVAVRKRSLPEDLVAQADEPHSKQQRPPLRPIMTRKRSSSLSQVASSSSDNQPSKGSFQSSSASSNVTSVSSDSAAPQKTLVKSSVVRALVSPTLPRESAVRGSAYDMHPTHSQDSANAVGALLSLAGNRVKGPSILSVEGNVSTSSAEDDVPVTTATSSSGLGLTVKPSPERRDSDQTALDMFRVRL